MNERWARVAMSLAAVAAAFLLDAGSSPALATGSSVDAGSFRMTGQALDQATIGAGSLRMTGQALDPLALTAGSLRMTGLALNPATIDAGSLRMTGRAPDRSAVPANHQIPHSR
jgi:hypothetical protein